MVTAMSMTKKDYALIAEVIAESYTYYGPDPTDQRARQLADKTAAVRVALRGLALDLSARLDEENGQFDSLRFIRAAIPDPRTSDQIARDAMWDDDGISLSVRAQLEA